MPSPPHHQIASSPHRRIASPQKQNIIRK
jgi:hypothetical protein